MKKISKEKLKELEALKEKIKEQNKDDEEFQNSPSRRIHELSDMSVFKYLR